MALDLEGAFRIAGGGWTAAAVITAIAFGVAPERHRVFGYVGSALYAAKGAYLLARGFDMGPIPWLGAVVNVATAAWTSVFMAVIYFHFRPFGRNGDG